MSLWIKYTVHFHYCLLIIWYQLRLFKRHEKQFLKSFWYGHRGGVSYRGPGVNGFNYCEAEWGPWSRWCLPGALGWLPQHHFGCGDGAETGSCRLWDARQLVDKAAPRLLSWREDYTDLFFPCLHLLISSNMHKVQYYTAITATSFHITLLHMYQFYSILMGYMA